METRRRRGMKTEPLEEKGEGSVQTLEESNEEEKTVEEIPIQPKKSKSKHLTKKLGTGMYDIFLYDIYMLLSPA